MGLRQTGKGGSRRVVYGLLAMTSGTAIIASSLALSGGAGAGDTAPLVNKTAAAIAAFQDMTPPHEAR